MDKRKQRKFYIDWWNIRKSTVYGLIAVLLFLAVLIFGSWWIVKSDWLSSNSETANVPKDSAKMVSFEGDVRIIRAATRETILVTRPTYVSAGDTVQTQADGKAQIQMIDGSFLSVKPNSTVVIRDSSSIFGGSNVRVALDNGQINVKTQDQPDGTNNVVEVKQAENKVFSQTDASFGINPKTNGGEIRISRGGVETNVGGEKTTISEGEFATVNPTGKLSPKEKLLAAPQLMAPAPLEKIIAASNGTADVTFRWQKSDATLNFNFGLQLSSSPFFVADSMVLERDPVTTPNFSLAGLTPGNYYWRIRATASSGQVSDWSEPSKFTIIKREESDSITASDWQVEKVGGNIYLISGKTTPGVTVRIQGRETFATGDGSFRLQVSAPSSDVTVEISDEHGNHTHYVLSLGNGSVIKQY